MIRFLFAAVSLACIIPSYLSGQFYTTGENAASVRWQQIKTENFKIIYPNGLVNDALNLAQQLEFALSKTDDLQHPVRKRFPVLMQNGSVLSNGFVTLAPSRMELQITPPQDSYAQDWISQLSLHEFRHLAQLNRLDQGTTRVLSWFSGEIARGLVSAQIPTWFFEGDAVYNETRLSRAGRGRSPGFEMPLRTLLIEKGKKYSYDKTVFGSYRDFVPDPYIYGYKLTAYLRSHFGSDVWAGAIDYVARNPYQIWPFSFNLKKNYNFYKSGLYNRTVDSLKTLYDNIIKESNYSKTVVLNHTGRKVYTSYLHPMPYKNNTVAFRTGLDDPGSFVLIDSSARETGIITIGRNIMGNADIQGSKIIWDEIVTDPRWQKRDYSVIREMDIATGRTRAITKKTRYFSPDFSPDGSKIVVSENDINNRNYLTVIEAVNGNVIQRISTNEKSVITPVWIGMDEIVMITVSSAGKQLESVDIRTGKWEVLIPFTNNNISEPVAYGNFVVFRADYQNTENLFAIERTTGVIFQITNSFFGARHPHLSEDQGSLLFSEYSSDGFNSSRVLLDTLHWVATPSLISNAIPAIFSGSEIQTAAVTPAPYLKSHHLFRFHSWLPFYTNIENIQNNPSETEINPGIILFSQNTLGTAISSIGYSYKNGYNYFHPSFTWRGWYPVIELSADLGGPQRALSIPDGLKLPDKPFPGVDLKIRTYIPLLFSLGSYTLFLRPEFEYEYSSIWYLLSGEVKKGIDVMHLRFTASNYRRMAIRDLYPVWGQTLTSTFSFQPSGRHYGQFYSARATLFFPGFLDHHHFYISAGHQYQHTGTFLLPYNRIHIPRGYPIRVSERFSSATVNYSFPVLYPDLALGPVFYLKRLRSNFFYDLGYGEGMRVFVPEPAVVSSWMGSLGTEITADFHALRMIFPLSAGIRMGYMPSERKAFAEFLIQVNTNL